MASPELSAVVDHLRFIGAATSQAPGGGLRAMRRMTAFYSLVHPSCSDLVTSVTPVEVAGVPAEWHTTPGADPGRRLLYLHGGGWLAGSLASHRTLVSQITAAFGGVALAVDYRLAPEHPFPAGLDDCLAAYRWLADNGPDGPAPASSLVVAGDSAGGNLALVTTLELRDHGDRLPSATVALSPLTDLSGEGESHVTRREADPIITGGSMEALGAAYTGGNAAPDDPRVAPLNADLAGLPPLLIQVGDAEVLLSDSTRLAERAEAAGVNVTLEVWDDMPHIFPVFAPFLPEANQAIANLAAFLRTHA